MFGDDDDDGGGDDDDDDDYDRCISTKYQNVKTKVKHVSTFLVANFNNKSWSSTWFYTTKQNKEVTFFCWAKKNLHVFHRGIYFNITGLKVPIICCWWCWENFHLLQQHNEH